MVLKIEAHIRQVMYNRDIQITQVIRGTDARELEEFRRVDGAARQHDLGVGPDLALLPVL